MLPALLIWLSRKYGKRISKYILQKINFLLSISIGSVVPVYFLMLLLLTSLMLRSQEKVNQYKVLRNDNEIGKVRVVYGTDSGSCHVKVISDIKFRVLFRFSAYMVEETSFSNNIMQYSSIYRKWNGNDKVNRQTTTSGSRYQVVNFGKATTVPYYPVRFHVLLLYLKEPVNIQQVYSENHQQFFELKKTGTHCYRLLLPDGDYNQYYYENGICTKVEMSHSFFDANMILQQ